MAATDVLWRKITWTLWPGCLKNWLQALLNNGGWAKPLVVIRDDSGVRLSHVTYDRSVGVSVLAGTRTNDKLAGDLARLVMAILTDDAIVEAVGSPVAAVDWDGCNGPYPVVEELDVARRYGTVQYTVVGSW